MQSGIGAKAGFVLLAMWLGAPGAVARGKDKRKDPEQIGNRDVGKGVNFYSLEKEIALGKQMAQEVEREAKIIEDPVIAEYVNRVRPEPGAQLRCEGAVYYQGGGLRGGECICSSRGFFLRQFGARVEC